EAALVFQAQAAGELVAQAGNDLGDLALEVYGQAGFVLAKPGKMVLGITQQQRKYHCRRGGRRAVIAVTDGGVDLLPQREALRAFQYGKQSAQAITGIAGILVETHG